jgi:hypothetical protein
VATLVEVMDLEDAWRPSERPDLAPPDEGAWGAEPYPADMFLTLLDAAMTWLAAAGTTGPVFCDLGAGPGGKVLLAARRGCRAWGAEIVPGLAQAARQAGADVRDGRAEDVTLAGVGITWCAGLYRDRAAELAAQATIQMAVRPGGVLMLGSSPAPPAGWTQITATETIWRGSWRGAWAKPA